MTKESFDKNSVGWQLQQMQQRAGEWWEWQMQKLSRNMPDAPLPSAKSLSMLWEILKGLMVILLVALLIWLGWQIWQRSRAYFYRLQHPSVNKSQITVEPELSVTTWLKRSQQFQQQGNYYQACRCLYLAMLQKLHDRGIIPHQGSRTDSEYLAMIQQLSQPQAYEELLTIHQQLCFGDRQASLSMLETCQQAYRAIEQL